MNELLRRRWHVALSLALAILVGFACRSAEPVTPADGQPGAEAIVVSAAASLQNAFREIGQQYEAHTGARVDFNFGASGALQKQIEAGAPVDVFASAGRSQMDALAAQGLIVAETQQNFARNALVLIVPANEPETVRSFAELSGARVKKLAIGNPKTVPAGQYAEQALTRLGLWQALQPRLVLAENVRQVLDYVARGEVEAGLVYATDVAAAAAQVRLAASAPDDSHAPILYPIAVVRASRQPAAARAFLSEVTSAAGQRILQKYNFRGPQ
jgi:molybdate transport system substrate-binding protein